MAFFDWEQSLEFDIPKIDSDHRKIVEMINALQETMTRNPTAYLVEEVLKNLLYYAATHFETEERFMSNIGYSALEDHIELHQNFTRKVMEMTDDFREGKQKLDEEILLFLKNWLVSHIKTQDRKYIEEYRFKSIANKFKDRIVEI